MAYIGVVEEKDPAAVALAHKRWVGKTAEDRLEVGRKLAIARKRAKRRAARAAEAEEEARAS